MPAESRYLCAGFHSDEVQIWYFVLRRSILDLGIENPKGETRSEIMLYPPENFFADLYFEPVCKFCDIDPHTLIDLLTITGLLKRAPYGYTGATRESRPLLEERIERFAEERTARIKRDRKEAREKILLGQTQEIFAGICQAA